jgi:hypothetical protein
MQASTCNHHAHFLAAMHTALQHQANSTAALSNQQDAPHTHMYAYANCTCVCRLCAHQALFMHPALHSSLQKGPYNSHANYKQAPAPTVKMCWQPVNGCAHEVPAPIVNFHAGHGQHALQATHPECATFAEACKHTASLQMLAKNTTLPSSIR